MTLSQLFGTSNSPANFVMISGGVTNAVITANPAILTGFMAGGIVSGSSTTQNRAEYVFVIQSGGVDVVRGESYPAYPTHGINATPINCPNGITVTTSKRYSDDVANNLNYARLSIFYI